MLLDFSRIFQQYNAIKPIRGVIHVGAHHGEESKDYQAHGIDNVVWFEALPNSFAKLKVNVGHLPLNLVFNVALSDTDGTCKFHVTDNGRGNSSSSSLLELGKHAIHYPHVVVKETINVESARFDTLARRAGLNTQQYNFLNVDVQGAELQVIRGMGDFLDGIDHIVAEVNEVELYKGCALFDELTTYLTNAGFTLVDKAMTNREWGDALYTRKVLLE